MKSLVLAAKAFSDPSRVRILSVLREQELCVCELCDALGMTQSTLSTHLQVIRQAGLISARKEGKWMYYGLSPETSPLVVSLFQFFKPALKSDKTLLKDSKNLKQRLSLRCCGSCCVGFQRPKNTADSTR